MCLFGAAVVCNAAGTAYEFVTCPALSCSADAMRCNDCEPGTLSCKDASTLLTCRDDGGADEERCARGCTSRNGSAACNSCEPGGTDGCVDDDQLRRCRSDGDGYENVRCPNGCSGGGCAGSCVPGATRCNGANDLRVCDLRGVEVEQSCAFGCVSSGNTGWCRECVANQVICDGDALVRCSADGQTRMRTTCPGGCDSTRGSCVMGRLRPSNLPATSCESLAVEDAEYAGEHTIDTDADCDRVIAQPDAPEICLRRYRDVRIAAGARVRVSGERALALVATRSFTLEGALLLNARGGDPGPGALEESAAVGGDAFSRAGDDEEDDSGQGSGEPSFPPANAGGGGGGHATPGGRGGDASGDCSQSGPPCAEPGAAGGELDDAALVPLRGGASGGRNSAATTSTRRATPGGGGGAIQLVSCLDFTLGADAIIDASGGGGGGGMPGTSENQNPTPGGGAGGGSGGGILIEAARLTAAAGAILVANGGGGGGGAVREMNGVAAAPGEAGQNGQRATTAANGGAPGGPRSRSGGAGGSSEGRPASGGDSGGDNSAAGGGGGATGRIRINTPAAAELSGLVISPVASRGSATFN